MNMRSKLVVSLGALGLAFVAGPGTAQAAEPVTLSTGHVDVLDVELHVDHFHIHLKHDADGGPVSYDPGEVVLHAVPESETTVPDDERFAFLGNPGDPVWILPQTHNPDVLFAGLSAEGVEPGATRGDAVSFTLTDLQGPGDFSVFDVGTAGSPEIRFDSGDGLPDVTEVAAGGHEHMNWAFEEPGDYTATIEVATTLLDGTVVTSPPYELTFKVGA
ncbi:choice-of-anchor M domain-containing protein [Streptomyces sp. WMMC500]|uniref:choice-of-anchor M domain-containing protein n=1 Tax=Streptomyces sp. WMMC500 TaxID=3015154 RepID=UPI00248CA3CB|nr:choice-of-anchor M domain-containing protein [Streptomyces sp. WMMC500]WBB63384.1 choice-of-anchor M domain-containing protein [Streptomyces sp. WMMC500]